MYRHSWFSSVLGVGTVLVVLMTVIGVSWSRFRQGGASRSFEQAMEDESEVEDIVEVEEPSSTAPPQDEDDLQAQGAPAQSICNKLKWFFIRKTLKVGQDFECACSCLMFAMKPISPQDFQVFFQCFKALVVVSIAVICFEAFMQVWTLPVPQMNLSIK